MTQSQRRDQGEFFNNAFSQMQLLDLFLESYWENAEFLENISKDFGGGLYFWHRLNFWRP